MIFSFGYNQTFFLKKLEIAMTTHYSCCNSEKPLPVLQKKSGKVEWKNR